MSVTVKKGQSGTTKTALQRANVCMQFKDCDVKVREELAECTISAFKKPSEDDFDAAMQACGDKAAATCKSGGGAKKTAPKKGAK